MSAMRLSLSLSLLALSACPAGKGDTGTNTGSKTHYDNNPPDTGHHDSGTDTAVEGEGEGEGEGSSGPPSVDVHWTSSGAKFVITNGSGDYDLGLVETDSASDPWTGEDCLYGYYTSSGTEYLICHPLTSTGGSLNTTSSISDLEDGNSYTLFDSSFENVLTYAIWDTSTEDCYTWGADTSYYTSDGCRDIN